MANICDNQIKIIFNKEDITEDIYNKVRDEFERKFYYEYFNPAESPEDLSYIEISMGTKWASPDETELFKFAKKHDVRIIGVSWEFGNDYVHSYSI